IEHFHSLICGNDGDEILLVNLAGVFDFELYWHGLAGFEYPLRGGKTCTKPIFDLAPLWALEARQCRCVPGLACQYFFDVVFRRRPGFAANGIDVCVNMPAIHFAEILRDWRPLTLNRLLGSSLLRQPQPDGSAIDLVAGGNIVEEDKTSQHFLPATRSI